MWAVLLDGGDRQDRDGVGRQRMEIGPGEVLPVPR
jgi:hypothetical protein